jgi:hypothetical protein
MRLTGGELLFYTGEFCDENSFNIVMNRFERNPNYEFHKKEAIEKITEMNLKVDNLDAEKTTIKEGLRQNEYEDSELLNALYSANRSILYYETEINSIARTLLYIKKLAEIDFDSKKYPKPNNWEVQVFLKTYGNRYRVSGDY